jgi:hypothetical protein
MFNKYSCFDMFYYYWIIQQLMILLQYCFICVVIVNLIPYIR